MKKLIIALIATFLIAGCGYNTTSDGHLTHTSGLMESLELVDVEFDGEVHQYLYYRSGYAGSLSHWADCKYCKEKELEEKVQ